jgi:hypothetical protein
MTVDGNLATVHQMRPLLPSRTGRYLVDAQAILSAHVLALTRFSARFLALKNCVLITNSPSPIVVQTKKQVSGAR